MNYIRWFFNEVRQCRWSYALVLLCQILMVAFALGYVWLSKRLVDVAILHFKGVPDEKYGLAVYAAAFLALSMIRPGIVAVKSYYQSKISVSMANRIRLRLFDDLLHLKNEYSRKYHTGDMLNRLQVDVSTVSNTFCCVVPNLFWAGLQFLAAFVYLLQIDARLAWILVLIIPIAIFGGRYVMYRVRNLTLDIRKSDSEVEAHIQESVQHIMLLQILEYTEASSEDLEELQMDNYEKNMRNAAMNEMEQFEVYYQPIVDITKEGNPCSGAEALVRWNSDTLGFIQPGDFIPLAEYLGLINPIGEYVMMTAAKRCKYWNDMGHPEYKVNVNLSVVQLLQNDIVKKIQHVIEETRINPKNLRLEVTESLAINDMTRMKKILGEIKELGVGIALDDFGTGYSSLNHIRELPIDVIKIDRCFIEHIGEDDFSDAFVKLVAELAKAIGVTVCVEGVEHDRQYEVIKSMEIKLIQGYYFGKPMTQEEFESKYL